MHKRLRFPSDGAREMPTAAALRYEPASEGAPVVVARGRGKLAEKIVALARANGVPVVDDPVLTACLAGVDIGEEIPPELYRVVAEVLAYIYRVSRAM
jgi:flagellar biosynthesis protein